MGPGEAAAVAEVIASVDDGCVYCAAAATAELRLLLPQYDWVCLVRTAREGLTITPASEARWRSMVDDYAKLRHERIAKELEDG